MILTRSRLKNLLEKRVVGDDILVKVTQQSIIEIVG